MTAQLAPAPVFRSWDNNGFPLVGGKLYTYQAGTTTPQATYIDSTQTTQNTNPVILNFRGEAFVWLDPTLTYKFILRDFFGNLIWTEDNIPGGVGASGFVVGGNILPGITNTYTVGSPTLSFANEYLGPNNAPVLDTNTGNIAYYERTAAEVYAGILRSAIAFPWVPGQGGGNTLNVFRYFTFAQEASCLAQDATQDMTLAIQAASNFLEGRSASGAGGGPHVGGTLFFPGGLYNINPALLTAQTLRVGGYVRWRGDQLEATTLNSSNAAFTGTLISLGPDESGFFPPIVGDHVFGSSIESMRVSLFDNNLHAVVIGTLGAHQGSHLYDIKVDGFNQVGISLGGNGGPAYFWMRDIQLDGGNTDGLPNARIGVFSATGSIVEMDTISIEGQGGHNVSIGIRVNNGSLKGGDLHFENVIDGVYFDNQISPNCSTIRGISGSSSCVNLTHINNPCNQTVSFSGFEALTGDPSNPVAVKNDVTGEALLNTIVGRYDWSGDTSGFRSGSFGYAISHNTPHIRYGKVATQAIAQNTLVVLSFPTKVNDWLNSGSEWSGTVFTPKLPGYYRVTVCCLLASTAWTAGSIFRLYIRKSGATQSTLEDDSAVGTFVRQLQHTDTVFCGVGDTIDTAIFQGQAASINTDSSSTTCYIAIDRQ